MDSIQMLGSVILSLGNVSVAGEANIARMHDIFNRLGALLEGMKKEKERHAEEIRVLNKQLAARPAVHFNEDGSVTLGGETVDMDTGEVMHDEQDNAE